MRKILSTLIFISCSVLSLNSFSQNVGIGTTSPTHALHIVPSSSGADPLKVEGLNKSSNERYVLTLDSTDNLVRRMSFNTLDSLIGNADTDVDSVNFANDTLYIRENGNVFKTEILASGTDTDIDSVDFSNDTLYIRENGNVFKTEILASGTDTDIDSVDFSNDTLYIRENGSVFKVEIPTSSGVATLNGYDTLEYQTGRVWIDGRPVYGRVIHDYTGAMPSINLSSYFPSNYIDLLLDMRIISKCNGGSGSTAKSDIDNWRFSHGSSSITGAGNWSIDNCGQPFILILEYVRQ